MPKIHRSHMNDQPLLKWTPIYSRDIRSKISPLLKNPPSLKTQFATPIVNWVMNHDHRTWCHAYFFLQCECATIFELSDMGTILQIVKQMKQLVYDYHFPTLIVQNRPPSEKQTHWNGPYQPVYTKRHSW